MGGEAEEAEGNDSDGEGANKAVDDDLAGGKLGEEDQALNQASLSSHAILLVTELGFGTRMPLSSKRMRLSRRGGRGLICMKLTGNDNVCAVCVVSSKAEIKKPAKAKEAWQFWYADFK